MKRALTGTFLAATFAVGLSAQSTTPPQSTPPQTPPSQPPAAAQPSRDAAKALKVTGCLKAGDSADSFMLSDLKWSDDKGAGAVGTSGAGAPAAVASATTLKIIPSGSTKLSEHVGHTVEVTGTVADKAPSAAPADPASTRPAAGGPSINASAVKMVAATCTP